MMLLPKFLGILPFDQANQGAQEAAAELKNPTAFDFVGPTAENSVAGPDRVHDQRADRGLQGRDALQQRRRPDRARGGGGAGGRHQGRDLGLADPVGEGESVFVAQVDFNETGKVMADMALSLILGADGGKFAILSASPDAANQNAWIEAAARRPSRIRSTPTVELSRPSTATTSRRRATSRPRR